MADQQLAQSPQESEVFIKDVLEEETALPAASFRGLRVKVVAAPAVMLCLFAAAAVLARSRAAGHDGVGQLPEQPQALWDQSRLQCSGRGFGQGYEECDCQWAVSDPQGSCSKVDTTPCWACCCRRLFPDIYHQAHRMQRGGYGYGDDDGGYGYGDDRRGFEGGHDDDRRGFEGGHEDDRRGFEGGHVDDRRGYEGDSYGDNFNRGSGYVHWRGHHHDTDCDRIADYYRRKRCKEESRAANSVLLSVPMLAIIFAAGRA